MKTSLTDALELTEGFLLEIPGGGTFGPVESSENCFTLSLTGETMKSFGCDLVEGEFVEMPPSVAAIAEKIFILSFKEDPWVREGVFPFPDSLEDDSLIFSFIAETLVLSLGLAPVAMKDEDEDVLLVMEIGENILILSLKDGLAGETFEAAPIFAVEETSEENILDLSLTEDVTFSSFLEEILSVKLMFVE